MFSVPKYTDVSMSINRNVGPRSVHGAVTLGFRTSDVFEFCSQVIWPEDDNYDSNVLAGIHEGFIQCLSQIPPCKVTLSAIDYHPMNSCAAGFQSAARNATIAACEQPASIPAE